jgi:hypothetical protein
MEIFAVVEPAFAKASAGRPAEFIVVDESVIPIALG